MKRLIVHLSDLHFRLNWEEDQELVLNRFFDDLASQLSKLKPTETYLVFSGDMVLAGSQKDLYEMFHEQFDEKLNYVGIKFEHRICIPGNHDVSQEHVKDRFEEHEGIVNQKLKENPFNDYISKHGTVLEHKFDNYRAFAEKFSKYSLSQSIAGTGFDISNELGFYCLNTALCSSGGYKEIDDRGRLAIDTRSLHKWCTKSKAKVKVLIMHHPDDWLTGWAKEELNKIRKTNFSLSLSGHVHEQEYLHLKIKDSNLIQCSAPPLLTNKRGPLGYSMIYLSEGGVQEIIYRQWTKNNSFVSGVSFSDTDDGKVSFSTERENIENEDFILRSFTERLNTSLQSFASQPIIFIEPKLATKVDRRDDEESITSPDLSQIIEHPRSLIVKGHPQFGLTCLARYIVKEAWGRHRSYWMYLDAKEIEWHSIDSAIDSELTLFNLQKLDIQCIVIDSWNSLEKRNIKFLEKLLNTFTETPMIVMQTVRDTGFDDDEEDDSLGLDFDVLHLVALQRNQIRRLVTEYNKEKHIAADDEILLAKVVSDLEVLNLHRTPLNCLTLLKVSEKYFDESPVNRLK